MHSCSVLTIRCKTGLILISYSDLDMPFAKWTKEQVCSWLAEQGLGSYLSSGKHWIISGQTLLQASQQDLEKVTVPILLYVIRRGGCACIAGNAAQG